MTLQKRRVHKISILDSLGNKSLEKSNERIISTLPDEDFSLYENPNNNLSKKDFASVSVVRNFISARQEPSLLEYNNAANFQTTHFKVLSDLHLNKKSASWNENATRKDKLMKEWRVSKSKRGSQRGYLDKQLTFRKEEPESSSLEKRQPLMTFSPIFYKDHSQVLQNKIFSYNFLIGKNFIERNHQI